MLTMPFFAIAVGVVAVTYTGLGLCRLYRFFSGPPPIPPVYMVTFARPMVTQRALSERIERRAASITDAQRDASNREFSEARMAERRK